MKKKSPPKRRAYKRGAEPRIRIFDPEHPARVAKAAEARRISQAKKKKKKRPAEKQIDLVFATLREMRKSLSEIRDMQAALFEHVKGQYRAQLLLLEQVAAQYELALSTNGTTVETGLATLVKAAANQGERGVPTFETVQPAKRSEVLEDLAAQYAEPIADARNARALESLGVVMDAAKRNGFST